MKNLTSNLTREGKNGYYEYHVGGALRHVAERVGNGDYAVYTLDDRNVRHYVRTVHGLSGVETYLGGL